MSSVIVMFIYLKAKDTYHARCFEFEKLKRENASHRDCERAETKMKRARMLMLFVMTYLLHSLSDFKFPLKPKF